MTVPFRPFVVAVAGRLVLAAVSLTGVLVIAEVACRVLLPAAEGKESAGSSGFITYDTRLGWVPVPGASGRITTPEFDVGVTLNVQGLRGSHSYSETRQPGTARVVVVGDSFSFGYGVTDEDTWVTRMERALAPVEMINLSVTGYGTDQQLLRLESEGLALRPDMVIVGLFEGNVFRNARSEQVGFPKPRFELRSDGTLALIGVPVPRIVPPRGFLGRTALYRIVGAPVKEIVEHLGGGEAWPVTAAILGRLAAAASDHDASLLVVVIPKDQAVRGTGLRRRLHERTLDRIGSMLENLGIDYLDLTDALVRGVAAGEQMYFPSDGHWTAEGHRRAAEAVVQYLRARGPFPEQVKRPDEE